MEFVAVAGGGAAAASTVRGAASEAVVVWGRGFLSTAEIGLRNLICLGGLLQFGHGRTKIQFKTEKKP
jgi:hypothetical protein